MQLELHKNKYHLVLHLQTEFELLNARLSEKADYLELAEEQLFKLYAEFQDTMFDGLINYPDSFNIRDYASDLQFYQMAKAMNIQSPTFNKEVDKEIIKSVIEDDEKISQANEEIDQQAELGQFTQEEVQAPQIEEEVEEEANLMNGRYNSRINRVQN
jgi:hypothetical protein